MKNAVIDTDREGASTKWKDGRKYPAQKEPYCLPLRPLQNKPYCDGVHTKIVSKEKKPPTTPPITAFKQRAGFFRRIREW